MVFNNHPEPSGTFNYTLLDNSLGPYYIGILPPSEATGGVLGTSYKVTVTALEAPTLGGTITGTYDYEAELLYGTEDGERIEGRGGRDFLYGAGGDDELYGGADNDQLQGGPGADVLSGGDGVDAAIYSYSDAGVTIRLHSLDTPPQGGHAEGDIFKKITGFGTEFYDIENLGGSDYADILAGDSRDNFILGRGGNDRLYGGPGGGNDRLEGGEGYDELHGGPGADELSGGDMEDTASYLNSNTGVTVRLHSLNAPSQGGHAEGDTFKTITVNGFEFTDIEHLRGSKHADILAGDSRDNHLDGMGGDDTLYGGPGGGDDRLYGGAGDDMFYGGLGNDRIYGGIGDDHLRGEDGDDTLYGGEGHDLIGGDAGNNIIYGGVGNDDLGGGAGNNLIYGGAGDDTLGGSGSLYGGDGDDTIYGRYGDDMLYGGNGDDTLDGQDGNDILEGGPGVDTFVYSSVSHTKGINIITDFSTDANARDKLDLPHSYNNEGVITPLTLDELLANIVLTDGHATIDLTSFNGGIIVLQSVTDLDELDGPGGIDNDMIDSLSIAVDANRDGDYTDPGDTDGIFIL